MSLPALRAALAALGLVLLAAAAAPAVAADPLAEALRVRIEALRARGDPQIGAGSAAARALVATLYERRGFAPLWPEAARMQRLRAAIDAAADHGLEPRDYHRDRIPGPEPAADDPARWRALAQRDLLHTDAFVRLAYHLYFGKADPRSLQQGWNFARTLDGTDAAAALGALLERPDPAAALETLAPQLPAYRNLRSALRRLREAEKAGGWPPVAAGPKLEPGDLGPRVAQLHARLRAGGDLPQDSADPQHYDEALAAAVRRFQSRHGLEPDGIAGRATLAALNVGVAARIAQLRANLERLRWVARELSGDYLLVDIAGFHAQLWLRDAPAWEARVVVGRPYRHTPEFRARMQYLVLNPEWNVPPTILHEDVLPRAAADADYLARQGMRVLDAGGHAVDAATLDWQQFAARPREFPYRIMQPPGRDNPLGSIKFMFPNAHSVYLHDTPSRALFERAARAFSSGCIRIDRPLDLARLLLDDPEHWSEADLREAIAAGGTRTLPVRRAVPVLLLYFTAVADADGEPSFRPDLYRRDAPILAALAAPFRFAPVDPGRRAAARP